MSVLLLHSHGRQGFTLPLSVAAVPLAKKKRFYALSKVLQDINSHAAQEHSDRALDKGRRRWKKKQVVGWAITASPLRSLEKWQNVSHQGLHHRPLRYTASFPRKALNSARRWELWQPGWAPLGFVGQTPQQGRAITQHAMLRQVVSHTFLSLADRHTCCDTVSPICGDWWRGEWVWLAGVLQGLCPVERKNTNWLPFGWEVASYSPCGQRLRSQCASGQYLQSTNMREKAQI